MKQEKDKQLVWQSKVNSLSKAQKEFNSAMKKYHAIQAESECLESLLYVAHSSFTEKIYPLQLKKRELVKQCFAKRCDIFFGNEVHLTKKHKELIRKSLMNFCLDKLEEDFKFYFKYMEKLESSNEKEYRLKEFAKGEEKIKKELGIDVDLNDYYKTDFESKEEEDIHAEKFREYKEKMEFYYQQSEKSKKNKKQSKAQAEKEKHKLELERMINQDINVLFKSLVKLIHPDTEKDPVLREQKLDLMTQLSVARDNRNIPEIFKIKLLVDTLFPNQSTSISFDDFTIKRFTTIVKSKIQEIDNELKRRIVSDPILESFNGKILKLSSLKRHIAKMLKENQLLVKELEIDLNEITAFPELIKGTSKNSRFLVFLLS